MAAPARIDPGSDGSVAPLLPLALLESMRAHDRPREVLEDEDLASSLPRRLGLTGVVESQIQRYESARRRGKRVPAEEVANLLRLVLRRPDAEAILHEAGYQVARRHVRRARPPAAGALRLLPRAATLAAARHSARRLLKRLVGPGSVEVEGGLLTARVRGGLVALLDADGAATCVLYASALEELVFLYTGKRHTVVHGRCATRGDPVCEWSLAE